VQLLRLNENCACPLAFVVLLPISFSPPEYPGCSSLKLIIAAGFRLFVCASLSYALTLSVCGCVFMITVVSFPTVSLLWLYVMLVASFLSTNVKSVPDVAVVGESFILNWKNHCPMRSVAGSLLEKFRSHVLLSLMQLLHVMLVWLMQSIASHFVGGLGVFRSMNTEMFSVTSGSPDEASVEKFQFGVPHPASCGTTDTVRFSSFFLAVSSNSPGSLVRVVSLL